MSSRVVGKAAGTKGRILERAVRLGALVGLEGLTLGRLAEELRLSKSGLYSHFNSKEELQLQVIQNAAEQFLSQVVRPALLRPRGEPRVVALFDGWLKWACTEGLPGGCLFVAAATEFDDRPGTIRDELVRIQRGWMDVLSRAIRIAQDERHYDPALEPEQLAFELHGLMLSFHHQARLLREPDALPRVLEAFAALRHRARGHRGESVRYRELVRQLDLPDTTVELASRTAESVRA